ncbi:MAG: PQQ-dependent sugar dehydrogenase [Pseudomonadota bacterium]
MTMKQITIAFVSLIIGALTGWFFAGEHAARLQEHGRVQNDASASPQAKRTERAPGGKYNGPACFDRKARPGEPASYCGDLTSLAAVNVREGELDVLVEELKYPWAFEFLTETDIIVTEFSGRLSLIDTTTKEKTLIEGLPEIETGGGQTGLMDVALHPDFKINGLIYISYSIKDPETDTFALAVSRAVLSDNRLADVEELIVAEPFAPSRSNFGGALMFDDQGFLFIGTGDRSKRNWSQDGKSLTGKILRLEDDGTVPGDNPFIQSYIYHPAIYALGVRNPQGLAHDPVTGLIYETEHGPMGGDEVNIIEAGANYGWPTVTYGMNYTYRPIGEGQRKPGVKEPIFYYLPSLAISPIEIYRGPMFPEWDGDLLVGALKGQTVSKLDKVQTAILSEARILDEIRGRIRDIKVADDGAIWILSQRGKLFRFSRRDPEPEQIALVAGQRSGQQVYDLVCSSCHSQALPGMPRLGVKQDWTARLAKGNEALYQSTRLGLNGMPARGLCDDCTDQELVRAVDYMIARVESSDAQ